MGMVTHWLEGEHSSWVEESLSLQESESTEKHVAPHLMWVKGSLISGRWPWWASHPISSRVPHKLLQVSSSMR